MNTQISLRLSAVLAVVFVFCHEPMLVAQAAGDRTQPAISLAKSQSTTQLAKPSAQPRPAQNTVSFTAVPPAPAEDAHARHREDLSNASWCVPSPWGYPPVAATAAASPHQAAGPSQEVVSSSPRIEEHSDERVQAMSRIGAD
jgi:hypothetical protein